MHFFPVPSPEVEISGVTNGSEFVSGSSLSLTCTIRPQEGDYVDTPTTVMSSWDAPNIIHVYGGDNDANTTSMDLNITSLETADSGVYSCSANVVDSSGSEYVVDSPTGNNIISIIVRKCEFKYISTCIYLT